MLIYLTLTVPQAQPAAPATAPEHANGKQTTPQPVPVSIPGSIQDYKGRVKNVQNFERKLIDCLFVIFTAPATASVTTPVTTPEITSRSMHPHPGAPPNMSQAKFLGNYYPYK